jgi:NAD-dependent deacetylase
MEELICKAAQDIFSSHYAVALTGAGISTESGISDYRGPSGVWTVNPRAEQEAYRSYDEFLQDPAGWWNKAVAAGSSLFGIANFDDVLPNAGHYALAEMESMGILKCTITQNVDSLHEKAGTKNLIEYHGSTSKFRCLDCGLRFGRDVFDIRILHKDGKLPPLCPECGGIIKTDTVFFGEQIPGDVVSRSLEEANKCDLMLICGTSAVVYPFASLPVIARERSNVTVIEVNAEPTPLTLKGVSDYLIRGKTGVVLPLILEQLKFMEEQRQGK